MRSSQRYLSGVILLCHKREANWIPPEWIDLSQRSIEIQQLVSVNSINKLYTWAHYSVVSHWSADTQFWQLSVDHNMDVDYQVAGHTSRGRELRPVLTTLLPFCINSLCFTNIQPCIRRWRIRKHREAPKRKLSACKRLHYWNSKVF